MLLSSKSFILAPFPASKTGVNVYSLELLPSPDLKYELEFYSVAITGSCTGTELSHDSIIHETLHL